jgi:membrane-bound lytic murein transglycosylase
MAENELEYFKRRLRIDEHALEVEWRDFPTLVSEIGEAAINAISDRDEAKIFLEETEAEVDKELREDAAASETKTTEKEIESQKKLDNRVRVANASFMKKKHAAALLQVLKDSFEQRSYALSKLTDLFLANYYGSVKSGNGGAPGVKDVASHRVKEELAVRRKDRARASG